MFLGGARGFEDSLDGPADLLFGADGNLLVISRYLDGVFRYDGTTGAFIDTLVAPDSNLLAGSRGSVNSGVSLTEDMLDSAVTQAIVRWAGQGAPDQVLHTLRSVSVQMASLKGPVLGIASPSTDSVWIDRDAAGHGWSADFHRGIDLLTVVTHELGHVLGVERSRSEADVMASTLPVGSVLVGRGLSPATGSSSLLSDLAGDDRSLRREHERGLTTADAAHLALIDRHFSRRLDTLAATIDDLDEDQDLVGGFNAKLLDDELVSLLATE